VTYLRACRRKNAHSRYQKAQSRVGSNKSPSLGEPDRNAKKGRKKSYYGGVQDNVKVSKRGPVSLTRFVRG